MLCAWLVMTAAAAAQGVDAERQLEAAIHRQVVLGDLTGAIEQYRGILAQPGRTRAVAGRAQLELARCLELLGRRDDARSAYRRAAGEFAELPEIARPAHARLVQLEEVTSGPRNLNFAQGSPGKVPKGWMVPALPKDMDYMAELRRDGCRSGIGCAVVLVPANAPRPFSQLVQSFSAAPYRGMTVRLRAWLRVEAAQPDDRAQMRLSVDRAGHQNGFLDNMDDRPVRSAEWTFCEITGKVDADATFIDIGIMSVGRGRVWADDVSFEVVK
jgi:hypothetical protein